MRIGGWALEVSCARLFLGRRCTVHTDVKILEEAMDHSAQSLVLKDMLMSARGPDSSAEDSNQTCTLRGLMKHGGRSFQSNFMFQPVL